MEEKQNDGGKVVNCDNTGNRNIESKLSTNDEMEIVFDDFIKDYCYERELKLLKQK